VLIRGPFFIRKTETTKHHEKKTDLSHILPRLLLNKAALHKNYSFKLPLALANGKRAVLRPALAEQIGLKPIWKLAIPDRQLKLTAI
jgi:hypothetical protein